MGGGVGVGVEGTGRKGYRGSVQGLKKGYWKGSQKCFLLFTDIITVSSILSFKKKKKKKMGGGGVLN